MQARASYLDPGGGLACRPAPCRGGGCCPPLLPGQITIAIPAGSALVICARGFLASVLEWTITRVPQLTDRLDTEKGG